MLVALDDAIGALRLHEPARPIAWVGAVGSGRTALAHEAARHAAAEKWSPAVVTVEPGTPIEAALARGMAAAVLRRLRRNPGDEHLSTALGVVHAYGLAHGVELPIDTSPVEVSWPGSRYADAGALFEKVADAMRTKKSGAFLALDDAGLLPRDHVAEVLRAAGDVSGAGKAFMLVVTGLPGSIPAGAARFAELRSLTPPEVLDALAWPAAELGVEIRHDTVAAIGRRTGGHPLYVQAFAAAAWAAGTDGRITPADVARVAWEVEQELIATRFAPAVGSLSDDERRFVDAVAQLGGEATFVAVAEALGDHSAIDPADTRLAPVRDALVGRGVVFAGQGAVLEFAEPYLGRYLRAQRTLALPTLVPEHGPDDLDPTTFGHRPLDVTPVSIDPIDPIDQWNGT